MGTHCDDQNCGCQIEQPTKKLFVAMSHQLTSEQISDFGGEIYISKSYVDQRCSQISANLTSEEVYSMAMKLIQEAVSENCTHIAINGEPALVFHSWNIALTELKGVKVVQSTTERVSIEVTGLDGTVTKTQVFKHVQWREIKEVNIRC